MLEIDIEELAFDARYRLLADAFQPRPVCLISTRRSDLSPHCAPFSFVSAVGVNPPTILFCPSANSDGSDKSTLQNVEAQRCFVANFVSKQDLQKAVTGEPFTAEDWLPATTSNSVRLAHSSFQLECDLLEVLRLGTGPQASILVIGVVRAVHRLPGSPVGKLSGADYIDLDTREIFTLDAS